jgi:hypothetical protein
MWAMLSLETMGSQLENLSPCYNRVAQLAFCASSYPTLAGACVSDGLLHRSLVSSLC